jgi:hypothetical protein
MGSVQGKGEAMGMTNVVRGALAGILMIVVGIGVAAQPAQIGFDVAASAAAGLFDTYLGGLIRTMSVLAIAGEVRTGDWVSMRPLLVAFQEGSLPMATWFAEPDGGYYTVDAGRSSANLSDRPYFPIVLSGEVAKGFLVVSRSTGRQSMVVAVPVFDGGQVIGVLGVSVFLDTLSEAIAEDLALPSDLAFVALTADDEIALHSDPDLLLLGADEAAVRSDDATPRMSELLDWTFWVSPRD